MSEPHLDAARAAAEAVHRRTGRQIDWTTRNVARAIIRGVSPLTVELGMSGLSLIVGEHLALSQFVRWWDVNYQLLPGDALLVTRLEDETWIAFDVQSDRDVAAGIRPARPATDELSETQPPEPASETGLIIATSDLVPAGGGTPNITITWNHHIVAKLEVRDQAGNIVGYVPILDDLT